MKQTKSLTTLDTNLDLIVTAECQTPPVSQHLEFIYQ